MAVAIRMMPVPTLASIIEPLPLYDPFWDEERRK
jgi:hypothetical protein